MTRYKSMAPPPPPADKRPRLMSASEASDPETVSLLMMFDDLVRNEKVSTPLFTTFCFDINVFIAQGPDCRGW